jgi:hypothetical protein
MESSVSRIVVDIVTSAGSRTGMDMPVFLVAGGREFRLQTPKGGAFEPGTEVSFVLGEESNVASPERNDPRVGHPLVVRDILANEMFVRVVPRGDRDEWKLGAVTVRVHFEGERRAIRYAALTKPGESLWFGFGCGTQLKVEQGELDRIDLGQ